MFDVIYKYDEKVYKVYGVLNEKNTIKFLIYIDGEWKYYIAKNFRPYKEVY